MRNELFKCVITPNVRTIELRSLPVEMRPGIHVIEDGSGLNPDMVVIPPGTRCIESFSFTSDGKGVVNETWIAGLDRPYPGPLPAPNMAGIIEITMPLDAP